MKISVLVAVYNSEAYLRECLDSLLSQKHRDLEVVCIDDCSTDASWQILEEYAARDSRIKLLRLEENRGQAYARNEGLKLATGEIIAYLDSDDWMDDDSLLRLNEVFEKYEKADCVLLRCRYVYPDHTEEYQGREFDVLEGKEAFLESLTWNIHGVYAARKELYDRCPFDCSSRHYSDDNTTRIHYYISREVRQSEAVYYYRQHETSVTHTVSLSRLDFISATRSMKRQLEELGCSREIMSIYEGEKWKVLIGTYKFYWMYRSRFSKAERKLILDEIRRGWGKLDLDLISPAELKKRGQRPFTGHWLLFRLQQEVLFTLRKLAGRL